DRLRRRRDRLAGHGRQHRDRERARPHDHPPCQRQERLMTMLIPGSEIFSSRPVDPDELRCTLPTELPVQTVSQDQADRLDPLTYEVVRHRLWSVTDEMS